MSLLVSLAQTLLPHMNPLRAQRLVNRHLDWVTTLGLTAGVTRTPVEDPVRVMGLRFPNRVGLAAGLDPAGCAVSAWGSFGFGHIEVGTIYPPARRATHPHEVRRLNPREALWVRGEPQGVPLTEVARNLKSAQAYALRGGILGLSLDARTLTSERLRSAAPLADYLSINAVDCPPEVLSSLLKALPQWRREAAGDDKPIPVALKLAPEGAPDDLKSLLDLALPAVDGFILTGGKKAAGEDAALAGGRLSGRPLREAALAALTLAAAHLGGERPLIASGGILSTKEAQERLAAGASLVQLFTGFILNSPHFPADCVDALAQPPAA